MFSPLPDAGSPFVGGTRFDISSAGYAAAEYAFAGDAGAYRSGGDGVAVVEHAAFTTRVLVYRPADAAAFNGTVWVEWLNVSGGLDAAPDWIFTHTELMRRGAAWVGVSAQKSGVEGGAGVLGMPSLSLVETNPARYGGLHHPGDRFSYDIYTQVAATVRTGSGTILDGLAVERVLAVGQSQSAFRLTTYVNEIDPVAAVHDGFLIHARGRATAPLDDDGDPAAALRGGPVAFRRDLRVPVLCVESETDLINLDYLAVRQDDFDRFVLWEIAGASHGDVYTFVAGPIDSGRLPLEELAAAWLPVSEVYGMALDRAVNAGPQHYVMNAAVSHLDRWTRDGTPPATSPRTRGTRRCPRHRRTRQRPWRDPDPAHRRSHRRALGTGEQRPRRRLPVREHHGVRRRHPPDSVPVEGELSGPVHRRHRRRRGERFRPGRRRRRDGRHRRPQLTSLTDAPPSPTRDT